MKLRNLLLATSFALPALLPLAAHAQPVTGPYISLGAGYNLPNNTHFIETEEGVDIGIPLKVTGGLAVTGGVGYGLGNGVRVALDVDYLHDNSDKFYDSYISNNGSPKLPGTFNKYAAMVNGYYDFTLGLPIYPYIGAGVGALFTSYKSNALVGVNSGDAVSYKTGVNAAIDFIVGVSYPVSVIPGLSLTAQYTFLDSLGNTNVGKVLITNDNPPLTFKFGFDSSMTHIFTAGLRYQLFTPPMMAPAMAAPMAAPAPAAAKTYLVFFDWDKSSLTPRTTQIIAEAASDSKTTAVTTLDVSGYTDTSGTPTYNQGLSLRRAKAVEAKLVMDGVPASEISIHAFGETHLLVPTGPGVREPQNRRVEIVLQ